jgi:hypothetical protein
MGTPTQTKPTPITSGPESPTVVMPAMTSGMATVSQQHSSGEKVYSSTQALLRLTSLKLGM